VVLAIGQEAERLIVADARIIIVVDDGAYVMPIDPPPAASTTRSLAMSMSPIRLIATKQNQTVPTVA
jgi:hypothetical protein